MEGRIYGKERFWGENERVQGWWKESGDAETGKLTWSGIYAMNLEEIDEVDADKKSQEVDSRDEVMHVGKSNQWFLE